MRLPFPTRIPYKAACTFAVALAIGELLEGTAPLFTLGSFLFIMIATAAFNEAEGFSRTSGSYVFFYSVLVVILGHVTKTLVGEPADSNLQVPMLGIWIYVGSIAAMYGAVYVSRRLTPERGILESLIKEKDLLDSAVGCAVSGVALTFLLMMPHNEGGILSALAQINRFLPLALILGTVYQIRKSGGTSAVNSIVLISGGILFLQGLWSFSKEGIFTAPTAWLIAAASQRFRFSWRQIAGIVAGVLFMVVYLVPYSQLGRSYQMEGTSDIDTSTKVSYLLSHLTEVRENYKLQALDQASFSDEQGYFNQQTGFLDRLQMIGPDDGLFAVTEEKGPFGLLPIYTAFGNLAPHFLWPDKPMPIGGNAYAHEIGRINADDFTTGISYSPSGEAYHLAKWYGVLLVAPIIWIMLFTLFDSLCGSTQRSPLGLLVMVLFGHVAPEGMLGGAIYVMGYISFGIVVAAVTAAYFMPILGGLVKGSQRSAIGDGPVRSIPSQKAAASSGGQ